MEHVFQYMESGIVQVPDTAILRNEQGTGGEFLGGYFRRFTIFVHI